MTPQAAPFFGGGAVQDPAIGSEQFVWLLGSLCRFHRRAFDASLALQQFPAPHRLSVLLEAARALGFRSGLAELRPCLTGFRAGGAENLPLPCVAFLRNGKDVAGDLVPALIARRDGARIVYFEAGSESPRLRQLSDLESLFEPQVVLFAPESADAADADNAVGDSAASAADADLAPELAPRPFGFRWFLPELARHKAIWRDVLVASAAIQVVGLATPLFTQVIVDKVVVHHTQSTLIAIAVAMTLFLVFNAVMSWMRQHLALHAGNRVDAVLASEVLRHLLRLPLAYFEHRPTGTTVARLQAVETIREFITGAAVAVALDLPFVVILLAVMFAYSWPLTLIALGALLLLAATGVLVTPVLRARLNRQFLLGARNQAFLTEYVAGMETVKSLQFEPVLQRRYGDYLSSYLAAGYSTRQLANSYNVAANAIEQAMTLAILIAGALYVMRADGFTIGMLVAFQMFAARLAQPMLRIAGLWQEFQQASIAVKRLGDIMNVPAEPHAVAPARAPESGSSIELRALAFRYSDQHPYLFRNLSLAIQPGKLVVITGPSGSGKSTLAKLLLGFYPPSDGRILLGGRDLRHLPANELRSAFGVVPQETVLFAGSVYDNLAMANPHAGFEEIAGACRLAGIHDAIERLPQGYATPLGEHGVGLSGGQKQRIAIARALLKKPKILIFDEAASSLDAPTAEGLAATINALKGKATILFIAHAVPRGLQADEALRIGAVRGRDG
jgi:subfamily B ATP-binding cassette protein HlyB/CyaB